MLPERWIRGARALLLGVGAVALAGCSSVVCRVNGENITRQEFHDQLERTQGLSTLQALIFRRLAYDRAEAEHLTPTADEVAKRFEEWKQSEYGGDETKMRQAMKAQGLDDTTVLEEIKFSLVVFRLRTKHLKPTDDELHAFFNEYHERFFDKPARVTFRQIVLRSKEEAQRVLARLNTEEAMFAQLAQELSQDPQTAAEGGQVKEVPWSLIKEKAPPIFQALQELQPNQVTQQPISVQGAWVVLKLIEKLPGEPANFADIKDQVKEVYLQANAVPEEQMIAEVAQNADVVVFDDKYKAAIEPQFSGQGESGLPSAVEKSLANPEITEPTFIDPKSQPKPTLPGDGN